VRLRRMMPGLEWTHPDSWKSWQCRPEQCCDVAQGSLPLGCTATGIGLTLWVFVADPRFVSRSA
jgi:hypothetical protein